MSEKINYEELKTLIANQIKSENLHEVLPEDAIERIKEKILSQHAKIDGAKIPEVVSEIDSKAFPFNTENGVFPNEEEVNSEQIIASGATDSFNVDSGEAPIGISFEPVMGYTPELPEMLKKATPEDLFVFDFNELGQSGENLSYKAMRLMNDPDVKKSMNDIWIQEGKTKANVYVAKFEKMGEIEFNYTNGTSKFTETPSLPDYVGGTQFKENPYAAESMPQIDGAVKGELETYIKSSVDLEKTIHDILMNVIKDSLLTNTEKAINTTSLVDLNTTEVVPTNNTELYVNESFKLTIQEIIDGVDYEKIKLPNELNENINSGNKNGLIRENESIQEWEYCGKIYITPLNRISKTSGYIKS